MTPTPPATAQRYDTVGSDFDHEEHPEGDWVRWEDHCRVAEELSAALGSSYDTIVTARMVGISWEQRAKAAQAERDAAVGLLALARNTGRHSMVCDDTRCRCGWAEVCQKIDALLGKAST